MPTAVGIHVFPCCDQQRRGWRAFARHDGQARRKSRSFRQLVLGAYTSKFADEDRRAQPDLRAKFKKYTKVRPIMPGSPSVNVPREPPKLSWPLRVNQFDPWC